MAKKDLTGSMDDLFGKRGATAPKSNATQPIKPASKSDSQAPKPSERKNGKKKVLPENFQKTNYIIDPEVIKKFKAIAVLRGESVNLLANEVLSDYVQKNFNL